MDFIDIVEKNHKILAHYGALNQISKMSEEMGELQQELLNHVSGRGDIKKIISEIADVLNVGIQMAKLFGYDDVRHQMGYKIDRTLRNMMWEVKTNTYNPPEPEDNIHYGE